MRGTPRTSGGWRITWRIPIPDPRYRCTGIEVRGPRNGTDGRRGDSPDGGTRALVPSPGVADTPSGGRTGTAGVPPPRGVRGRFRFPAGAPGTTGGYVTIGTTGAGRHAVRRGPAGRPRAGDPRRGAGAPAVGNRHEGDGTGRTRTNEEWTWC
ncbi:hypothetical protein GCM10027160_12640 [Streptomyces calidiresistens]